LVPNLHVNDTAVKTMSIILLKTIALMHRLNQDDGSQV
jgi:hypothetical protein